MHPYLRISPFIARSRFAGLAPSLRALARRLGVARGAHDAARDWPGAERRIAWIAGAAASGDEAQAIREAIVGRGLGTVGEVAQDAAERLYRRDHARGGWDADIGLFSPSYLAHVRDAIERLRGVAVIVDEEASSWR